jgi:hypothetical protein
MSDPIKKRIQVSRDVKFDESKVFNWDVYLKTFDTSSPEWIEFVVEWPQPCDIQAESNKHAHENVETEPARDGNRST